MIKHEIKDILIDLIDLGFNINVSNRGDILSVLIKYDVPDGDYQEYEEWLSSNSKAKNVIVSKTRLTDSCRVLNNRECLGNFSYKYKVKPHTDRLDDHLKINGYDLYCVHSQKNGMRFANHGQNFNHICDYPYKLKFDYKKS